LIYTQAFYNDCYCLTKTSYYEETLFIPVVRNQNRFHYYKNPFSKSPTGQSII